MLHVVILAGGRGERFWPLSNKNRPKQVLPLVSDLTMFEETVKRAEAIAPAERIHVVTSESLTGTLQKLTPSLPKTAFLAEPEAKNTCTAIAFAAVNLLRQDPAAVMAVLSADHNITPVDRFVNTITAAAAFVETTPDAIMTIGIPPTRAETGYGYIELGQPVETPTDGFKVHQVESFKEKPAPVVAQEYLHDHKHFWNSGMFVWSAHTILRKIAELMPEMGRFVSVYGSRAGTDEESEARAEFFRRAPGISVDYAVLEQADTVYTIVGDFAWDDVGAWTALARLRKHDKLGNVSVGRTAILDSYECIVHNSDEDSLVALLGASDLVVVRTDRVTLVAHRSRDQEIRQMLATLNEDTELSEFT
jgi:mannose-1-phosphate guanylyltransferase